MLYFIRFIGRNLITSFILIGIIIFAFITRSSHIDPPKESPSKAAIRNDWETYNNAFMASATTIQATVTFYSPRESNCKGKCVTASGTTPEEGRTVACPRDIPFGTKARILGHDFICEDRMNARYSSDRFDIYIQNYAQAKELGLLKYEKIILSF